MSLPVRHIVGPLSEGMQRCVICGHVISDYRNAMVAPPQRTVPTWPEGSIYIQGTNPTVFSTTEPEEGFIECV